MLPARSAGATPCCSRRDTSTAASAANFDETGNAALGVDGASGADRLMGRAERRVAADFAGDGMSEAADGDDVLALRRLGQAPVEVQLALPLGRDAARGHFEGSGTEMPMPWRSVL